MKKRVVRQYAVPILFFISLSIVACVDPLTSSDSSDTQIGSITVNIAKPAGSLSTIEPDVIMEINSYNITVSGPQETQSTTLQNSDSQATFHNLQTGEWTVIVHAKNSANLIIASGTVTVDVISERTTIAQIEVKPLTGHGTLELKIEWPANLLNNPAIEAILTSVDGDVTNDVSEFFTINGNTASYSGAWIAGYMDLGLRLKNGDDVVWPVVAAVRIIKGQVSSATFELTEEVLGIPPGEIQVIIQPVLQNPYKITLSGIANELPQGDEMVVTMTSDPEIEPEAIWWFLNGNRISGQSGDTVTFGGPTGVEIGPGTYWLDVIVRSGATSSSQRSSSSFKIVPIQISAGNNHTMILETDGTLWGTGENFYGQLGDTTTTDRLTPVPIMTDVAAVSAGGYHTMILKTDGTLWGTGDNSRGQLGDGTTINRSTPVLIMTDVVAVSTGNQHTMILKKDGSLLGTGFNRYKQLGDGTKDDRSNPVPILDDVAAVSAALAHTMILKNDGTLWGTGSNSDGKLGDGTTTDRWTPEYIMNDVAAVSAGDDHTMILKTDGTLLRAGRDLDSTWNYDPWPQSVDPVQVMDSVATVSAGGFHTMILKTDGTLWAMGGNWIGQLGDGTKDDRLNPVLIMANVSAVSAGREHTIIQKYDGTVWGTGFNWRGQIGDGTTTSRSDFVQIIR